MKEELIDDDVDLVTLAEKCDNLSGSDLKELCRFAALNRFISNMKDENKENKKFEQFANEYDDNDEDYDKYKKIRIIDLKLHLID